MQVEHLVYAPQHASLKPLMLDRSNISIAILPMTKEFNWTEVEKGFILSSFFYGYMATQTLGGYMSDKYGGKQVLFTGMPHRM
jgi:MFS family permease